jgi:hypothetical protein
MLSVLVGYPRLIIILMEFLYIRYCGNVPYDVHLDVSSFVMVFKSDPSREGSGFALNWKPKE